MWTTLRQHPFFSFLLVSFLLRGLSFFYTVIDHDESTYLVIAQQLLNGKQLYVDVWDTKPVGIFVIVAGILKVFGEFIVSLRIIACIVVASTAYLLYKTSKQLGAHRNVAFLAGLFYIILLSSYRFGMAVNTEVFFNFFVIAGTLTIVKYRTNKGYFLAGLLWGAGFIIKYVVLFDVFAILVAFLLVDLLQGRQKDILKWIRMCFIAALGFVLPFLVCNLYFHSIGTYESFFYATFVVPGNYKSAVSLADAVHFIVKFHIKFIPIMFFFYVAVFRKMDKNDPAMIRKIVPLVWFLIAWVPLILPGKFFDHYYAQLMLSVSMMSSEIVGRGGKGMTYVRKNQQWLKVALPLLVLGLIVGNQSYFYTKEDTAKEVSVYLKDKLGANETIYAGKRMQAVYFLLKVTPPTKYVHPTLLTFPSHIRTLEVDADQEFESILQHEPKYMVFPVPHPNAYFGNEVAKHYRPIKNYRRGVVLFERK